MNKHIYTYRFTYAYTNTNTQKHTHTYKHINTEMSQKRLFCQVLRHKGCLSICFPKQHVRHSTRRSDKAELLFRVIFLFPLSNPFKLRSYKNEFSHAEVKSTQYSEDSASENQRLEKHRSHGKSLAPTILCRRREHLLTELLLAMLCMGLCACVRCMCTCVCICACSCVQKEVKEDTG